VIIVFWIEFLELLGLTYILINNVEIGHREQTKPLFVSSIFDGQFHKTCHPFREIPVLELPHLRISVMSHVIALAINIESYFGNDLQLHPVVSFHVLVDLYIGL
jgi:hypothetical protein